MQKDTSKLSNVARSSVTDTLCKLTGISPSQTNFGVKSVDTEESSRAKPLSRRVGTIHLKH